MTERRNRLKSSFLAVPILCLVLSSPAQEPNEPKEPKEKTVNQAEGKSVELSDAFEQKKQESFKYIPVISEFWDDVEKELKKENYPAILKLSQKQINRYGEVTPEGQEGLVALGLGFYKLKFWGIAFHHWMSVARSQKGTMVGDRAILFVDQMIKQDPMSSDDLYRLFDTYQIENRHPDVQNVVAYFSGMALLKHGHQSWGQQKLNQIQPESYWGQLYLYWSAVALVAVDKVESAEKIFRQIYSTEGPVPRLKDLSGLQLARLSFEKGQFEEAFVLYQEERDLGLREKGRMLLEKAWTKFYLGDYGRSMGILHALKSPFFSASATYEAFVLEMLIFRQLCQYDFVKYSADVFRRRFGKSIKRIQSRASLKRDPNLFSLAVMNLQLQEKSNLIARLRREEKELRESDIKEMKPVKAALKIYKNNLRRYQFEMDLILEPHLRKVGNELLRADEQIKFLEYISSLDALKLSEGEGGEAYKASRISNFEFEKIYWPVTSEYWYDELETYSMKISSVCESETDQDQKKLEENFK